ncbi:MAG: alpha-glucan family phosphorylase [Gemmatimonadaceae bacterium]
MTAEDNAAKTVAYFSMEICLDEAIPTYSGGLGVLAGDTLRSAADLHVPMVAVTLLHRKGYFQQRLDANGQQAESPVIWHPEQMLEPVGPRVAVEIGGRRVRIRAWKYEVHGLNHHTVPVYLLDTALPENSESDQQLTDYLYGGDSTYRLSQEVVLGMGGAALLAALGYDDMVYHINEGHAALLTLTLLERQLAGRLHWDVTDLDLEAVRKQCVFTTHTPVPAGHDKFPLDMVREVVGTDHTELLTTAHCCDDTSLNMTYLALRLSRYINGVAMRHREVSAEMFPAYPIDSITNGVHASTWASQPFRELFDLHIPQWRRDNLYLRYAVSVPLEDIRRAHRVAKQALLDEIQRRSGVALDPAVMTIGFARRATPYKRGDLIFTDLERLKDVAQQSGKIQIVFGGKAHPRDDGGKALIRRIFEASEKLEGAVRVVYLENYEMSLAKLMTSGVDLWLNTPMKPLEASGTSGMKAALNGVPSLSVLDGWWLEACVEGVTGWSIGTSEFPEVNPNVDAADLYMKLERAILPLFYGLPGAYAQVMRFAIALNGAFFNTQRMVTQYLHNAYFPANGHGTSGFSLGQGSQPQALTAG